MDSVIITCEFDSQKIVYTIPEDSDAFEYVTLFKSLLTFLTFQPETIKEAFEEEV